MSIRKTISQSWSAPASRLDWIIAGVTVGKWAHGVYQNYKTNKNTDITLQFSSDDAPFHWLSRWLETLPRQEELRNFRVVTASSDVADGLLMLPNKGIEFEYRGVKCWLEEPPRSNAGETLDDILRSRAKPMMQLRMRTRDRRLCVELLEEVKQIAVRKEPPKVMVYSWSSWVTVRKVPPGRSAILPGNCAQSLADDLVVFRKSQKWYNSVGRPYRRGYLLHGIPGSGKTSLVVQLASEFELNVCILNLSQFSDASFSEAMRYVPEHSLVLFEDIDCAWEERETKDRVTFSGLLNVLDGVATPDGRVVFMTTNHRSKLDDALVRPGRIDYELEFTFATAEQIEILAKRFDPYSDVDAERWAAEKISMATVQERLSKLYRPRIEVAST